MNKKATDKTYLINCIAFIFPVLIIIITLAIIIPKNNNNTTNPNTRRFSTRTSPPAYRSYPMMGTWAEVSLYGDTKTTNKAMDIIHNAFNKINIVCTRFDQESELSQLNSTAAKKPYKCSKLLWDILLKSKYFYNLSDGTFDITITPLMNLWGFYQNKNTIPTKQEVESCLTSVGLNKVIFNKKDHSIFFTKSGTEIDLGGIAKGYAVDYAYELLKDLKIKSGVINLGGNIRFFPIPPPGKKYYTAGIRNPFCRTELMNNTLKLIDKSLATSGDYEQFIIIDGQRFTHIINPKTGYPVKDIAAVTIVTNTALECDALSTAIFINGINFAKDIHKRFTDIDILLIKGYHNKPETVKTVKIGEIW